MIIALNSDSRGRFLDFGGGHGIFVRRMRDLGLDFHWEDKYCANLYAAGFEADPESVGYSLCTCFEVVEHLENPLEILRSLLDRSEMVLFSTELAPMHFEQFWNWPYIGQHHGQHIGFMQAKSLDWLASALGVQVLTNRSTLHFLSHRGRAAWRLRIPSARWSARMFNVFVKYDSLTLQDNALMAVPHTNNHSAVPSNTFEPKK
jgi:hypothetical protein